MGLRRAGARGRSGGASRPRHVQGHLCGALPPTWLEHPRVGTPPTHPLIASARRDVQEPRARCSKIRIRTRKAWERRAPGHRAPGPQFPRREGAPAPPATPIPPSPPPGRLGYSPGISPPWSSHPAGPWGAAGVGQGCGGAGAGALHLSRPRVLPESLGAPPRCPARSGRPARPCPARALPGRPGRDRSCVRNGALRGLGKRGGFPTPARLPWTRRWPQYVSLVLCPAITTSPGLSLLSQKGN